MLLLHEGKSGQSCALMHAHHKTAERCLNPFFSFFLFMLLKHFSFLSCKRRFLSVKSSRVTFLSREIKEKKIRAPVSFPALSLSLFLSLYFSLSFARPLNFGHDAAGNLSLQGSMSLNASCIQAGRISFSC